MAARHRASAADLTRTLNVRLWRADLGYHAAWNVNNCVDTGPDCGLGSARTLRFVRTPRAGERLRHMHM